MVDREHKFFLSDFAKRTLFRKNFLENIKNIYQLEELAYKFSTYEQRKNLNKKIILKRFQKLFIKYGLAQKNSPRNIIVGEKIGLN